MSTTDSEYYFKINDPKKNKKENLMSGTGRVWYCGSHGVADIISLLTTEDISLLPGFLKEYPTITGLYITSMAKLDLPTAKALSEFLKTNTTIKSFKLDNYAISYIPFEGKMYIMDGLRLNSSITTLEYSYKNFATPETMKIVAETLTRFPTVNLSYAHFDIEFSKEFFATVEKNTTMTTLDLGGMDLTHAAGLIAAVIKNNKTLQSLSLLRSKINWRDCELITNAFSDNTSLTEFKLGDSNHHYLDDGIVALAKALKGNPKTKLEKLSLINVCREAQGMEDIFDFLASNKTVKFVDLSYNHFLFRCVECKSKSSAMEDLAKMLSCNTTLETLILNGDVYAPSSIIMKGLEKNQTLTCLSQDYYPSDEISKKCAENKARVEDKLKAEMKAKMEMMSKESVLSAGNPIVAPGGLKVTAKSNTTSSTIVTVMSNTASASVIAVPSTPVLLSQPLIQELNNTDTKTIKEQQSTKKHNYTF